MYHWDSRRWKLSLWPKGSAKCSTTHFMSYQNVSFSFPFDHQDILVSPTYGTSFGTTLLALTDETCLAKRISKSKSYRRDIKVGKTPWLHSDGNNGTHLLLYWRDQTDATRHYTDDLSLADIVFCASIGKTLMCSIWIALRIVVSAIRSLCIPIGMTYNGSLWHISTTIVSPIESFCR